MAGTLECSSPSALTREPEPAMSANQDKRLRQQSFQQASAEVPAQPDVNLRINGCAFRSRQKLPDPEVWIYLGPVNGKRIGYCLNHKNANLRSQLSSQFCHVSQSNK